MTEKLVACCDGRHATPFCPDCGKKLRERSPIDELLAHLALTIKKHRTAIQTMREHMEKPDADQIHLKQRIEGFERGIEKHERWREAIRTMRELAEINGAK